MAVWPDPTISQIFRQTYVDSVGYCTFSPAEQQVALRTMTTHLATGHWPATDPAAMNDRAVEAGTDETPRYLPFTPERLAGSG
jgi:hypothetical protein